MNCKRTLSEMANFSKSLLCLALIASTCHGSAAYADDTMAEDMATMTAIPMLLNAEKVMYAQRVSAMRAAALRASHLGAGHLGSGALGHSAGHSALGHSALGHGSGAMRSMGSGSSMAPMAAVALGVAGAVAIGTVVYIGVKTAKYNKKNMRDASEWQHQYVENEKKGDTEHDARNAQVAALMQQDAEQSGVLAGMPADATIDGMPTDAISTSQGSNTHQTVAESPNAATGLDLLTFSSAESSL